MQNRYSTKTNDQQVSTEKVCVPVITEDVDLVTETSSSPNKVFFHIMIEVFTSIVLLILSE